MRTCSRCKVGKPLSEFYLNQNSYCKECIKANSRIWAAANRDRVREGAKSRKRKYRKYNPDPQRDYALKRAYGISIQDWKVMLEKQEGLCAICCSVLDQGRNTHVDHDHATGMTRSLLCSLCNKGLGHFKDNAENLVLAAKYIQDHAARAVA